MAKLEVSNLTKAFTEGDSSVIAVDDVDLIVDDGEFLVLVGPSGCGKSTTLRCIAGLETATEGAIQIGGETITDAKPKDRNIAMVFQNYALYPQKTVRGNMRFGLEMTTDLSDGEIEDRVRSTAEMLGISDLLDRKPNALSGGQQQRVALGRAIVRDPEVFLMDEPLSNLDAKLCTQMRTELQELQDELGVTTVYVTHDQTEAMTMGDRIAVLNDGELQQIGTPLECYYDPANQFVAGFIGSPSMNFIPLTVENDGQRGVSEDLTYEFSEEHANQISASADRQISLGIRPEDIEPGDAGSPHSVEIPVNVIEPMGKETMVHFELNGMDMTASIDGDHVFNSAERMQVKMPEQKIHVFDDSTGEAVFTSERSDDQFSEVLEF